MTRGDGVTEASSSATRRRAPLSGLIGFLSLIACALLWAPQMVLAQTTLAAAQNPVETETASLTPADHNPVAPTALPEMMNARDAALYRRIFNAQKQGAWRKADKLIKSISNDILMGHVAYQRLMHPTHYRAKYKELKQWMDRYADHPGAMRVYRLALRRQPKGWRAPKRPIALPRATASSYKTKVKATRKVRGARASRSRRMHMRRMENRIKSLVRRERPTQALRQFETKRNRKLFTADRYDQTLGIIARGYYHAGKDKEALAIAQRAVKRSGGLAPMALWWGGLTAWRLGDFGVAADLFERMAHAPNESKASRAAAAYWGARAYLVNRQPGNVTPLLIHAATAGRSFYGILAQRALGEDADFDWSSPVLGPIEIALLNRIPSAKRALALIQIEQTVRAEEELKRIARSPSPALTRVLLALSNRANLPAVSVRIGARLERTRGERYDAALYPLPGWTPEGGYKIDRALIFALMRQESRFKTKARSRSGAAGLMQLMPATARFISNTPRRSGTQRALFDPAHNIALGQKYLQHLMSDPTIGPNLFYTTAAYNAGPGNLRKWRRKTNYQNDPLLFIESIRSRETRNYVEHVMTNFWAYRLRLGQPTPSLDAVAAGEWPVYIPFDQNSIKAAFHAN